MFYYPYNDDNKESFLSIVYALGLTGYEKEARPDNIARLQIEAIEKLEKGPYTEEVNRALLLGLRNSEREIVNRTTKACSKRLTQMSDEKHKSDFMGLILDACFLNLSGRRLSPKDDWEANENRRILDHDQAASQLLNAVAKEILSEPLKYSHHISRILSRARHIQHLEGAGLFAEAVVKFQNLFSTDPNRVYQRDAEELKGQRKLNIYALPTSSESTLLAYLNDDSKLEIRDVSQELIRKYRILLNVQTKRRPVLKTLKNLTTWLEAMPSPQSENWDSYVNEMVNCARIGEEWEALDLNLLRHLEVQFELLPGRDHREDLFQLLQRKYAAPEQEEVLIAGLRLLTFMPVMRIRADELIDFVHERGKRYRTLASWRALIELIESHITGLEDLVLTRESLDRKDHKRLRVMNRTLATDKKLRDLLYEMSVNSELKLSDTPETEVTVREAAWRSLLRSLPANRTELFQEGVLQHDGRFFLATLEEATKLHQRTLWNQLLPHWDQLLIQNLPEEEKSKRLKAVARYFEATRNFDAIRHDGQDISHLLKLALDHEEANVRDMFLKAIVNAGYRLEMDKEIQRRHILNTRKDLTKSNERVIELEDELARLHRETVERQKKKADCVFGIQEGLQERDRMITEGWINNSQFQVSMEEIREALAETLDQAAREYEALQELQRRMRMELEESRRVRDHVQNLVDQHRAHARERDRLQNKLNRARRDIESAESELSRISTQINRLQQSMPSEPRATGDPESDRRATDRYDREVREIESEIRRLQNRTSDLEGEVYNLRRAIRHCEKGISREKQSMARLRSEIDSTREEIRRLERNINVIRSDFRAGQERWRALRREIERLRTETDRIADQFAAARERATEALKQNSDQIEGYQQELTQTLSEMERLSNLLNQTSHHKDHQTTRSQELVQAIDSGRHHYDDLAEKAIPESANADDIGYSLEARENQKTMERQESQVHYAYGTSEALSRAGKPPTFEEQKKQKHHAARRRRLTS